MHTCMYHRIVMNLCNYESTYLILSPPSQVPAAFLTSLRTGMLTGHTLPAGHGSWELILVVQRPKITAKRHKDFILSCFLNACIAKYGLYCNNRTYTIYSTSSHVVMISLSFKPCRSTTQRYALFPVCCCGNTAQCIYMHRHGSANLTT